MKKRTLEGVSLLLAVTIVAGLTFFGTSAAWAQEKHKLSYKWPAGSTRYTQQHAIDVGDVPGHRIRLYEIQRTWADNPPAFDGVRVKEEWLRGYSDYTDVNGRSTAYYRAVLANGDTIFGWLDGTSQTHASPGGSGKSTFAGVLTFTGGTGKFLGIRGMARYTAIFDPKAGLNEGQIEGEYWIAQ